MTRLMTHLRPLSSIHRIHRSRRAHDRRGLDVMALLPGADERLVTRSELDQLRRLLPDRVI
jgi:hypothetical protein